jgi:hypothetical protein
MFTAILRASSLSDWAAENADTRFTDFAQVIALQHSEHFDRATSG